MENSEQTREWVMSQTALLDPPARWQPDAAIALSKMQARIAAERPRPLLLQFKVWAAAAAMTVALLMLLPAGRVVAQQLWQILTVRRVAFIRVHSWPAGVPSPKVNLIGTPLPPLAARDVAEVRWRVRYDPRLPRPGVLASDPKLSTMFSLSAGMVVNTADLELALRKAGIADSAVPARWDGANLAVHTGAIVIAEWEGAALAQSPPLTLTAPEGFDFFAYSALVLRILGAKPDQAERLAREPGAAPPWLAPVTSELEALASFEEITLASGPATLMELKGENGAAKQTVIAWSVPDRVYVLRGTLNRDLLIAAANAIPY